MTRKHFSLPRRFRPDEMKLRRKLTWPFHSGEASGLKKDTSTDSFQSPRETTMSSDPTKQSSHNVGSADSLFSIDNQGLMSVRSSGSDKSAKFAKFAKSDRSEKSDNSSEFDKSAKFGASVKSDKLGKCGKSKSRGSDKSGRPDKSAMFDNSGESGTFETCDKSVGNGRFSESARSSDPETKR